MIKTGNIVTIASLALLALGIQTAQAGILITIEAPGVQSSQVSGVTTMDFNSTSQGSYTSLSSPIGTYTAPTPGLKIVGADAYGGSNQSQYMAIGAQSGQQEATLDLGMDRSYFGFFYGAGDNQNVLKLYKDNALVLTYSTADLISFLNTLPNKSSYYGNPNTGANSGEPYAYLNFYGTNGTVFNKVVFSNLSTGTGFETDNHSVRTDPVGNPGGTPVPEPGTVALLAVSGIGGAGLAVRRRLRK